MENAIVVMPGSAAIDLLILQTAAEEFGCAVDLIHHLHEAIALQTRVNPVALLFHRDALGPGCPWTDAIRLLRKTIPEARLIACYGFAEPVEWEELSDAGAFHSLVLPLKESEVRQSLGFIGQAEKRGHDGADDRKLTAVPRATADRDRGTSTHLANRAAS